MGEVSMFGSKKKVVIPPNPWELDMVSSMSVISFVSTVSFIG